MLVANRGMSLYELSSGLVASNKLEVGSIKWPSIQILNKVYILWAVCYSV